MVIIKGKILLLISVILFTSFTVVAYQFNTNNTQLKQNPNLQTPINNNFKDNSQNEISDSDPKSSTSFKSHSNSPNTSNSNSGKESSTKKYTSPKSDINTSDAQSIAQKYIEEPGAVAGTPEKVNMGGKCVDAVPVLIKGKAVGEIDIDPKTGKNVGGAGGAPN